MKLSNLLLVIAPVLCSAVIVALAFSRARPIARPISTTGIRAFTNNPYVFPLGIIGISFCFLFANTFALYGARYSPDLKIGVLLAALATSCIILCSKFYGDRTQFHWVSILWICGLVSQFTIG